MQFLHGLSIVLLLLSFCHIFLLGLSNFLVQYPLTLWNWHTTWGAFSYPLIFILTDLTTRLLGSVSARRVILLAMFPGFVLSFALTTLVTQPSIANHWVVLRIAAASFTAYVVGQFLDIYFFQKWRQQRPWWLAPLIAAFAADCSDTYIFFSLAFYASSLQFMAKHWQEIATVDLIFKMIVSITFLPLYGLALRIFLRYPLVAKHGSNRNATLARM